MQNIKYKSNGITIERDMCTIDQNGICATYKMPPVDFRPKAEAVLMDLDGTSVYSEKFWIYVIERTVAILLNDTAFQLQKEDFPFVSGFTTISHLTYCKEKYKFRASLGEADATYHITAKKELELIMQGKGNKGSFTPREGLKEFLCKLKEQNIKIGLATSGLDYKAVPEIMSLFAQIGLGQPNEFYDAVITGGRQKDSQQFGTIGELAAKPHPWIYQELFTGLKLTDKSKVVVLEDSAAGVIAARTAGISVIGFNDGNIAESGLDELCLHKCDDFEQVKQLIL